MMPGAWWVWLVALAVYVIFRLWYDNWRGPLTRDEIEGFMTRLADFPSGGYTDPAVLRAFLEADDGREFVMSHLVRVHPGDVPHPETGVPTRRLALLQEYGRRFVIVLLRHGGHPMLVMRKVGGHVDSWNTPADPGWHVVGAMRYRSRRDMMALATHPSLREVHPFKTAGTAMTFSFPTQVLMEFALRPRVWVALVLSLAAALAHLASVVVQLASHRYIAGASYSVAHQSLGLSRLSGVLPPGAVRLRLIAWLTAVARQSRVARRGVPSWCHASA